MSEADLKNISSKDKNHDNLSTFKVVIFSFLPLFFLFLMCEIATGLFFYVKGEIKEETPLAFHPLFRSTAYANSTYSRPRFTFDPFLAFRYVPSTKYGNININAHGFIDGGRAFPTLFAKPPGKIRIFLFGGSTVAGSGASSSATTISAYLENILNKKGTERYDVINAGVDGYFSYQELGYFISDIIYYQPDIVIFYDGYNDYASSVWIGGYKNEYQKSHCRVNNHEYALYLLTIMPKLEKGASLLNVDLLLGKTYTTIFISRLYKKIVKKGDIGNVIETRRLPDKVKLSPEEAASLYTSNVESAVGTAIAHGVRIIYALQPTIFDKEIPSEDEKKILADRGSDFSKISDENLVKRYYQTARDSFKALGKKFNNQSVQVVDISENIWQGVADTIYLDECHTNDRGNFLIAQNLSKIVEKINKKKNPEDWKRYESYKIKKRD